MTTARHRDDVIAAHQRLRDALTLSKRPTSKAYAIGVFTGRLDQVVKEQEWLADLYGQIDWRTRPVLELRDRVLQIRDAVTNLYINGEL